MFGQKKIKTKKSNVHDSLKVMGSNPGYLLKSSLLHILNKSTEQLINYLIRRICVSEQTQNTC